MGLTEYFNETLFLLARKLGWTELPIYRRRNTTGRRPTREMPKESLAWLADRLAVERELYRVCQQRFLKQLDTLTPADHALLEQYRAACEDPEQPELSSLPTSRSACFRFWSGTWTAA